MSGHTVPPAVMNVSPELAEVIVGINKEGLELDKRMADVRESECGVRIEETQAGVRLGCLRIAADLRHISFKEDATEDPIDATLERAKRLLNWINESDPLDA